MTTRAKVGKGGRITIPKDVRDYLGIKPGDWIDFDPVAKTFLVVNSKEKRETREGGTAISADWDGLETKLARVFGPIGVGKEQIAAVLNQVRGTREEISKD